MKILVVEDDPVTSELMEELIAREEAVSLLKKARSDEEDLELVGTARTGQEGLQAIERLAPDLVVLDLHLPGLSGLELLRALQQSGHSPRVLVVSNYDQEATQLAVARAGARGFVSKTVLAGRLADAIRAVARGETWYSAAISERILRGNETSCPDD